MKRIFWVLMLGLLLAGLTGCGSSTPTLDEAKAKMEQGDYEGAFTDLQAIVEANPDDVEAQFQLGMAALRSGHADVAQAAFQKVLELDPTRAAAVHHNLGVLYYQQGQIDEAIAQFEEALAEEPDDPDTHYQLGAAYLVQALPSDPNAPVDTAKVEQAIQEFEHSLAVEPEKAEALVGLGNAYLLEGKTEEAIAKLEEALKAAPEMPEALFTLGQAYAQAGRIDEAKAMLHRFLETDPPDAWAQQAQALLAQLEGLQP